MVLVARFSLGIGHSGGRSCIVITMRIALLWSENLIRESLALLLESRGRFDIVISTTSPRDCLSAVKEHQAHVIVAQASALSETDKQFLLGAKVFGGIGLVLLGEEVPGGVEADEVDRMLPLSVNSNDLIGAIRAAAGNLHNEISVRSRGKVVGPFGLTMREHEIAALVAKGYSNRRIAEATGVQEQSVKNLVSTIIRKLQCENRTQVALRVLV